MSPEEIKYQLELAMAYLDDLAPQIWAALQDSANTQLILARLDTTNPNIVEARRAVTGISDDLSKVSDAITLAKSRIAAYQRIL